jgi:nitrite reductase/ring-hydroxylating ferredoxin subunit
MAAGCIARCRGWGFDVTTGACDVRPELPVGTHPVEVSEGKVLFRCGWRAK